MDRVLELFFDLGLMRDTVPALLTEGLRVTLILAVGATVLGLVLGMVLALGAISTRWWLRLPAVVYIDIFRGLPAILTISLIGIGLPAAGFAPWGRSKLIAGIVALGLIATAYMAEIFRSGIQSIDDGQMEAGRSLGMSHQRGMRLIVIPQAVRRVIPPLTNEFIALTKDTSLIFTLGMALGDRDLFRVGQNLQQQTGNSSPLVAAGLAYLLITIPMTRLTNYLERRLRDGRHVALVEEEDDLVLGEIPGGRGTGGHL